MNYAKKLFIVDEPKYRQLMLSPAKREDADIRLFNQNFIQNKHEALASEDAAWAKVANRVTPILQSGISSVPGTSLASNAPVQGVGASGSSGGVSGGGGGGASGKTVEDMIKDTVAISMRAKALRLLHYLEQLEGVNFLGDKISVDGQTLAGNGVDIIEDLIKKKKSLLFSIEPLLKAVSEGLPLPDKIIQNIEAKQKIDAFKSPIAGSQSSGLDRAATSTPLITDAVVPSSPFERTISVLPRVPATSPASAYKALSYTPQTPKPVSPTRLSFESALSETPINRNDEPLSARGAKGGRGSGRGSGKGYGKVKRSGGKGKKEYESYFFPV